MKIRSCLLLFFLSLSLSASGQESVQKNPGSELVAQIKKEHDAKNYKAVIELCRQLIKEYPRNRNVQAGHTQMRLLWSLHYENRHDEVNREAKKFIDSFPEHAQIAAAYYLLGIAYEQLGEAGGWHEKAREAYQKALETERSPSAIKRIKRRLDELNESAQSNALEDREATQADPAKIVIINDPLPSEEGLPAKANLGTYVILTDLAEDDPYYEAVEKLSKLRKARQIVRFVPKGMDDVALPLKELGPEYVCVVAKPETIDPNLACQLLELSTKLDSDPFPDFLFGFITGASADEAVEFVKNMSKADKRRASFPRRILHLSKSSTSRLRMDTYEWATGFTALGISYEGHNFLRQHFDKIRGNGILAVHASGATPGGIANGLNAEEMASLDVSPAVVFSSASYTGVTTRAIRVSGQSSSVVAEDISPEASFCLKVIASGATGYFAPFGSAYQVVCSQEIVAFIRTGDCLGRVMKHTHDGAILARREGALQLPRLVPKKPRPPATSLDWRIHSSATRVLYGDPALKPLPAGIEPAMKITVRRRLDALKITCQRPDGDSDASFLDAYRMTREDDRYRNNDQIRFTFELPRGFDKNIKSVKVHTANKELAQHKPAFVTCMVEKWGGKKLAHFQMDLPPRTIRHKGLTFDISLELEK